MPVRQPSDCWTSSVPPQVCSTSSRCAAMARMSTVVCEGSPVDMGECSVRAVGEGVHIGDVEDRSLDGDVGVVDFRTGGRCGAHGRVVFSGDGSAGVEGVNLPAVRCKHLVIALH